MKKSTKMKAVFFFCMTVIFTVFLSSSLTSCKKDKEENEKVDPPAVIFPVPGMGESSEELKGTAFVLPSNVEIVGQITGADFYMPLSGMKSMTKEYGRKIFPTPNTFQDINTKSVDIRETVYYRGSGTFVSIKLCLENKNSTSKTIEFPAGLTFKNVQGTYQNGLLVKKTSVFLPANEQVDVIINAYCSNLSRHPSDIDAIFEIGPIVDIPQLNLLFEKVKNKKINIEEYDLSGDIYDLMFKYLNVTTPVQDAVWEVTDYDGQIKAETLAAIDTIPNSGR